MSIWGSEDLVRFLRAQLDKDERKAQDLLAAAIAIRTHGDPLVGDDGEDDARQRLREVEAKRLIIAEHLKAEYRDDCRRCFDPDTAPGDYDFETFPCPTLRALALPYADRDGYREEWRP